MYSFLSSVNSFGLKDQVREQIFSLLGNRGKTFFSENTLFYAEVDTAWYQKAYTAISDIWNTPYKKLLSYAGIILSSLMIAPPDTSFAAETTQTFIVTAYYSPAPGQSFYLKGNYEAEKRLNGNGTHGASGTPVFTGMIAAPKSYDFGTQIFFEGLGVGTVEDRGGAIVEAWDRGQAYDRIDIWMGYGETGLRRALAWGRREVRGTIMSPGSTVNMNPIDLTGIDTGRVNLSLYPSVKSSAQGGVSSDVLSAFADLGYAPVGGDITGMLIQFQLDHKIIQNKDETGAGNYGPKTKLALKTAHDRYMELRNNELDTIEKAKKELLDEHSLWEEKYKNASNSVSLLGNLKQGDTGTSVVALQTILRSEGFFQGKADGKMRGATLTALKKYQKNRNLAITGKVDSSTQQSLILDIIEA